MARASPTHTYLDLISKNAVSPTDAPRTLIATFDAKGYDSYIENLDKLGIHPQAYIDGLDRILDTLNIESHIYRRGLQALRKTCGIYGLLPSSYTVSGELTLVTTGGMRRPFASGGYSDVWKAVDCEGHIFAIKQLRFYLVDDLERVKKQYCKEVVISKRIEHENVLNMVGVARPELFEFSMVSKWADKGNISQYVRAHPQVDRMRLLRGITRGLNHLHSIEVVHGDLKGPNILIDERGNPLLADFGLSSLARNSVSVRTSTPRNAGGTIRWCAPELLESLTGGLDKRKRKTPTEKSDIYSLSMVIIELFTGNGPFPDRPEYRIILGVMGGERPPKPLYAEELGLTPAIWELTKKCWHMDPAKRPNTKKVLAYLANGNATDRNMTDRNTIYGDATNGNTTYGNTIDGNTPSISIFSHQLLVESPIPSAKLFLPDSSREDP